MPGNTCTPADTLGNTHAQRKSILCASEDVHIAGWEHLLCLRSGLALLMQVSIDSSEARQVSWVCADLPCVSVDRDPAQLHVPCLWQLTDSWK